MKKLNTISGEIVDISSEIDLGNGIFKKVITLKEKGTKNKVHLDLINTKMNLVNNKSLHTFVKASFGFRGQKKDNNRFNNLYCYNLKQIADEDSNI